jgi:hypothetical protein
VASARHTVLVDLGVVDERLQLLDAELPAGDRRELEKLVALRREPVETPADDVPDALWNADAPVAPAHGPVHQASLVDEQADDLGHEPAGFPRSAGGPSGRARTGGASRRSPR